MLSAEENPGLIYFMVGMIVLVMSGVGLSILVDKRLESSSGANVIQSEIQLADEEVQTLRERHQESSMMLAERGPKLLMATAARAELMDQQESLRQRHSEFEERRRALLVEIPMLEQDLSRQLTEYHRRIRLAASGEKVGSLTVRGDREYHEVVITRVTGVGIEIRHQHGIARVMAADLDPKWQERFQWREGDP